MIENSLREVMSSRAGRDVVWHLLGLTEPFKNPYTGEPLSTAYECGRRESGIRLTAWLMEHAPDAYIHMQQEQLNAARSSPDSINADAGNDHRDADSRDLDDGAGLRGIYPVPGGDDDGRGSF